MRNNNGACLQLDVKETHTGFASNTQNLSNIKHCQSAFIDEAANITMTDEIKKEGMATINKVVKLFKESISNIEKTKLTLTIIYKNIKKKKENLNNM